MAGRHVQTDADVSKVLTISNETASRMAGGTLDYLIEFATESTDLLTDERVVQAVHVSMHSENAHSAAELSVRTHTGHRVLFRVSTMVWLPYEPDDELCVTQMVLVDVWDKPERTHAQQRLASGLAETAVRSTRYDLRAAIQAGLSTFR